MMYLNVKERSVRYGPAAHHSRGAATGGQLFFGHPATRLAPLPWPSPQCSTRRIAPASRRLSV